MISPLVLLTSALAIAGRGGRPRVSGDSISQDARHEWTPKPPLAKEAKMTICQITDVYTLEHFASLKTMLKDIRKIYGEHGKVVSMLTGDFLSPYLLSSVDRGAGMMNALAKTPIDILTWGNHEADIDHRTVCQHVKNFPGTFINTNMQDHEAMQYQKPFEIIECTSPDGSQTRRVGLIAVLSDDPALYQHFPSPGAFGGATITDPWETLREYKKMLESPPYNCDLVVPLQHLYVPDDIKTCKEFDFPVILSGHDHHRVDETVHGTRLLKPGSDAEYATLLDICWPNCKSEEPKISARFVPTNSYKPDPELHEECTRAYDALLPLRNTELAMVPPVFEPLSSSNARGSVTTMGKLICTLLRSAMNVKVKPDHAIDAVMLMGGNIRGGTDYPPDSFFSLEALEAEVKSDEVVGVVQMPGWVLAQSIEETHAGAPIPGWFQYDNDIRESNGKVTHVGGFPLDNDKMYRVATKISDLTNGQSPTLTKYYENHPELLPPKGNYVNIFASLMTYFARNLWSKLWEAVEPDVQQICGPTGCLDGTDCYVRERFEELDRNGDGTVSVQDIQTALRDTLGLSVHERELTLAKFVHDFADLNQDGKVTMRDMELFCKEIPRIQKKDMWKVDYRRRKAPAPDAEFLLTARV